MTVMLFFGGNFFNANNFIYYKGMRLQFAVLLNSYLENHFLAICNSF